jgi:hypothetical protein
MAKGYAIIASRGEGNGKLQRVYVRLWNYYIGDVSWLGRYLFRIGCDVFVKKIKKNKKKC